MYSIPKFLKSFLALVILCNLAQGVAAMDFASVVQQTIEEPVYQNWTNAWSFTSNHPIVVREEEDLNDNLPGIWECRWLGESSVGASMSVEDPEDLAGAWLTSHNGWDATISFIEANEDGITFNNDGFETFYCGGDDIEFAIFDLDPGINFIPLNHARGGLTIGLMDDV